MYVCHLDTFLTRSLRPSGSKDQLYKLENLGWSVLRPTVALATLACVSVHFIFLVFFSCVSFHFIFPFFFLRAQQKTTKKKNQKIYKIPLQKNQQKRKIQKMKKNKQNGEIKKKSKKKSMKEKRETGLAPKGRMGRPGTAERESFQN